MWSIIEHLQKKPKIFIVELNAKSRSFISIGTIVSAFSAISFDSLENVLQTKSGG